MTNVPAVPTIFPFDEQIVSDLHKDAFGFRPSQSFYDAWAEMSDDEKQAEWDSLIAAHLRAFNEEESRQKNAITAFEVSVKIHMEAGAADRETAIRWIVDSLDLSDVDRMYGGEYVCFELGLPYSMEAEFDAAL